MSNLDTILAYLRRTLGLTPAQAAGVAGNLQVESGFNPAAYNEREGAIGLAQWEGGRRTALQNYARSIGSTETDLSTQLAFLAQELRGSENGAFQRLLTTSTAGEAASVFDQFYERSAGTSRDTRVTYAQNIYNGAGGTLPGISDALAGVPFLGAAAAAAAGGSSSSSSSSSGRTQSIAADMGGMTGDIFTIGLKILGAGTAAALVIVGAVHTVK